MSDGKIFRSMLHTNATLKENIDHESLHKITWKLSLLGGRQRGRETDGDGQGQGQRQGQGSRPSFPPVAALDSTKRVNFNVVEAGHNALTTCRTFLIFLYLPRTAFSVSYFFRKESISSAKRYYSWQISK